MVEHPRSAGRGDHEHRARWTVAPLNGDRRRRTSLTEKIEWDSQETAAGAVRAPRLGPGILQSRSAPPHRVGPARQQVTIGAVRAPRAASHAEVLGATPEPASGWSDLPGLELGVTPR